MLNFHVKNRLLFRVSPVTTVRIYSTGSSFGWTSVFRFLRITQPFDSLYLCTFQISQNILWMIEDKALGETGLRWMGYLNSIISPPWSFLTALTLSHIDRFITRITGYHISKWVHKSTNWHFGICAYRALFSKVSRLITFFSCLAILSLDVRI